MRGVVFDDLADAAPENGTDEDVCVENLLALVDHYTRHDDRGLETYSQRALARVWKGQRFSWWMTTLLHRFPDNSPFERRLQDTDVAYLFSSRRALASLAENYVGLPY